MHFDHARLSIALAASGLLLAAPDRAAAQHEHAGDIFVEVVDSTVLTGNLDEATIVHGHAVFGSELGELGAGFEGFADEPGFDAEDGTFAPGTLVGFNIIDALRVWNGSDFSEVSPVPMDVWFPGFDPLRTSDGFVEGQLIPADDEGGWHHHLNFQLVDPEATGIYLLCLELVTEDADLDDSDPVYIVFNNEADEEDHEAAIEYAHDELMPGVKFEIPEIVAGTTNVFEVIGATPGGTVYFAWSRESGSSEIPGCAGVMSMLEQPTLWTRGVTANAEGVAETEAFIPLLADALGTIAFIQAIDMESCTTSNWISHTFGEL